MADSFFCMGTYKFRVPRRDRRVTRAFAIRRARETAFAHGIALDGEPVVKTKHEPLPLLGPRRVYVVTFRRATRKRPTEAVPPAVQPQ